MSDIVLKKRKTNNEDHHTSCNIVDSSKQTIIRGDKDLQIYNDSAISGLE